MRGKYWVTHNAVNCKSVSQTASSVIFVCGQYFSFPPIQFFLDASKMLFYVIFIPQK